MKLKDIPQAINEGNWECNFPLHRLVAQIEAWCAGEDCDPPLEMNPDFQRGHVWAEDKQIAFVETLFRGGAKNARVLYLNNPNWMKNSGNEYKDFVCVDGLQRYTAVRRFIQNEIPVFGLLYREFEDKCPLDVDMRINVNELPTRADVLLWYLQVNDGGVVHTAEEIERVRKLYIVEMESRSEPV